MLTEEAKKFLFNRVPPEIENENPFVVENGVAYLQFDSIEITNANDEFGGINIGFRLHSKTMLVKRLQGTGLKYDDSIILTGIEGRTIVTIE